MKKLLYSIISIWFCLGTTILSQNPKWINYNTTNSDIPSNSINCIAIDALGNKWIGTREGLAKFDGINPGGAGWTVYNESNSDLPGNYVYSLAIDVSGNKWIGTQEGLAKFDGLNWTIYDTSNSGLPHNYVYSLAIDGSGNKWIGTHEGLAKFDDTYWNVYNPGSPYIHGSILSLAVDVSNNVWFKNDGLTKFDGTIWTHYPAPISGGIMDRGCGIAIDELGNKWIGIDGELLQFDDTIWTIYTNPFPHSLTIWDIEIDESSIKWLTVSGLTESNLRKFNGSNWEAIDTSGANLSSAILICIAIDESDNKWIGTTSGGLFVFNEGGIVSVEENLSVYPTEYALSQNYPNPFNPTTKIKYSVPKLSFITIKIYDVLGSEVAALVNEEKPTGTYELTWNAVNLPSGVYFYQLKAVDPSTGSGQGFVEAKKMLLLK